MRLLLVLWSSTALVAGRSDPNFFETCGSWRHCLESHTVPSDVPFNWFEGWNATVQPKLEQLLVVSRDQQEDEEHQEPSTRRGLMVVMAGDSTIIQQFQVLSEFVRLRDDYQPVVGEKAEIRQKYELTFGAPRDTSGSVTFLFYRVFEACMLQKANPHIKQAYALYFGCGMHLLHLLPTFGPSLLQQALYSWDNYEDLLTSRVNGYRQGNKDIKLVYMTTHGVDESKFFGPWHEALVKYGARDATFLEACKKKFDKHLPPDSSSRNNLEQACLDSVFGARGVELLNGRGIAAMDKAGVSIVPAHKIVKGQSWATQRGDGRHYPYLVPLEIFWFLMTLEGLP